VAYTIDMKQIQALAREGLLPRVLAKCRIPICAGCLHGKLTRKAWRHIGETKHIETVSCPGECVSVDQMNSNIPGLVGQIKGIPTRLRCQVATIFVDHMSDHTYVFLQTYASSQQTLLAKKEFEQHAMSAGIKIQKYHADNGRFVLKDYE
jgi:hypothetical protein